MVLTDPGAERAVLAGLFSYGLEVYVEISDIIDHKSFGQYNNQVIYKCIDKVLKSDAVVDIPAILSAAEQLNLSDTINEKEELEYIQSLTELTVKKDNVLYFAGQIRKFEFARSAKKLTTQIGKNVEKIKGDEGIDEIIAMVEDPITDFLREDTSAKKPESMGEDIEEYVQFLMDNSCDQIGISSGYPRFDAAIGGGLRRKCVDLVAARPKAQPLTSKVLTPKGWKHMGDLSIGDKICHPKGGISTVTNIINHDVKECFRFSFSDKTSTEACSDHLWKIKSRRWKGYKTLSWNDIKHETLKESDRYKWQLPLTKPVFLEESDLPIDPYVLGALIGDGSLNSSTVEFTTGDIELADLVRDRLPKGFQLNKLVGKYQYSIIKHNADQTFGSLLSTTGLRYKKSHDKFIPKDYLYGSMGQRISLLQGLMDTDGHIGEAGALEYTTVSKQLEQDFIQLVRSLGGRASSVYRQTSCNNKKFWSYRINLSFNDSSICFKLNRKLERCSKRTKPNLKRLLRSVESVGFKECQCITIDNPDGLYITDDYIVTHNCGKSVFADNIAIHVSENNIPVLMLDTEMSIEDHRHRILSNLSNVTINDVAKGAFKDDPSSVSKVLDAAKKIKNAPYVYVNVSGEPFEQILNIIKRWIIQEVGVDENGKTNDCLVIYDYLKLMSSGSINNSMQEYQVLGFQITQLHNLTVKYDFPCLSFVQLNRDGVTKETTDAVSGSDRLVWLCTSFSIFKHKSTEELAEHGPDGGNRKLIPIVCRHGPAMEDGNYINMDMAGAYARLKELRTRDELRLGGGDSGLEGANLPFEEAPFEE